MRVFSSNPYHWLIISIIMLVMLGFCLLHWLEYPNLSLGLFLTSMVLAYLIVPRFMNVSLVLEIDQEGLVFEDQKLTVPWSDLLKVELKNDEKISFKFKTEGGQVQQLIYESRQLHRSPEEINKQCAKYLN